MLLRTALRSLASRTAPADRASARRRTAYRLRVESLEDRAVPSGYVQENLTSDVAGAALVHDPGVVDAWGISINPNGTFWLSARATDVSTVYNGDVTKPDDTRTPFAKSTLTVAVPGGAPTGQVFNGSGNFVVSSDGFSAPA